jgi:hypothetical protein
LTFFAIIASIFPIRSIPVPDTGDAGEGEEMMGWSPEEQREHRKLWVEALRSGKYEQAAQALRRGQGFCCLGVACDISGVGEWSGAAYVVDTFDASASILPRAVRDWLGLAHVGAEYGDRDGIDGKQLTAKNDSGATFAELADIIESEPEGLISKPEAA